MNQIENLLTDTFFNDLSFVDQRERNVLLEYLSSFSFLFYTDDVHQIIEIGAGHSTLIFSYLAKRTGCKIRTIDMNPEAIIGKLRDPLLAENVINNIEFVRGSSVSCDEIISYYQNDVSYINNIEISEVLKHVDPFIDVEMDNRKEMAVSGTLGIERLTSKYMTENLSPNKLFSEELCNIYRTEFDEFSYCSKNRSSDGVLADLLDDNQVDMVFLDSGEFVSLVEWEIVAKRIRSGGYVYLHDIYFPKSYKNWLVCASISASDEWEILYQDTTTPQGMLLARKN